MGRPIRIDRERILWIGDFLIRRIKGSATAYTETEDHLPGDLTLTLPDGTSYPVEVKTIRQDFNGPNFLYPRKNRNWFYLPEGLNRRHRYWMLNAIDGGGGKGKGFLLKEYGCALAYIMKDGVVWFTPEMLVEAYLGLGVYYTTQRQEFEAEYQKRTYQCKFLVDLDMGHWTPCTPPEELFKSETHENFNRDNKAAER